MGGVISTVILSLSLFAYLLLKKEEQNYKVCANKVFSLDFTNKKH